MAWLYVDATFGISGDMMLAGLIDLGLDPAALARELAKLIPEPFDLRAETLQACGVRASRLVVECEDQGHVHRTASDLMRLVTASDLPPRARQRSLAIIDVLAEAEARVHGISKSAVNFHEVGAVDSIIDMVGTAIGLEWLGIEGLVFSPPALGRGTVVCRHGRYPIPAPATAYVLEGVPLADFDADGELTTPTGAAILKALASSIGPFRGTSLLKIGYGAGTRTYSDHPNVIRTIRFEPHPSVEPTNHSEEHTEHVSVISANLDDLSPELLAHASQQLLASGALDVWMEPVVMKKGRPGVVLNALTATNAEEAVTACFFQETSTFGVRIAGPMRRHALARQLRRLDLGYGQVDVKIGQYHGQVVQASAEYETVASLSRTSGRTARAIYADVMARLENGNLA